MFTPQCAEQFTDRMLKTRLADRTYVPVLEELVHKRWQEFERLKGLKAGGRLDFGEIPPVESLSEILTEVKGVVDSFLDVKNLTWPLVTYYRIPRIPTAAGIALLAGSTAAVAYGIPLGFDFLGMILGGMLFLPALIGPHYASREGKINLYKESRATLIPTMGHEYAHHVQVQNDLDIETMNTAREGHARGVARHVASQYRVREDNEAFLWLTTTYDVQELHAAYRWACAKHNITPPNHFRKIQKEFPEFSLDHYNIGNAFFSVQEVLLGNRIYRDFVHGEFSQRNP